MTNRVTKRLYAQVQDCFVFHSKICAIVYAWTWLNDKRMSSFPIEQLGGGYVEQDCLTRRLACPCRVLEFEGFRALPPFTATIRLPAFWASRHPTVS
jgi:hypothetical protein